MDYYYGFSLSSGGTTNTSAYYYVSITQGSGSYDGAAVTVYPKSTSATYFNYRSSSLQWQAPPSQLSAGMTVVTGGSNIIGVLGASPAINVDVTLICSGNAGQIGSVTLTAGQTEMPFNFQVSSGQSLGETNDFLAKHAARPEPTE
jgi:hypothetical protein